MTKLEGITRAATIGFVATVWVFLTCVSSRAHGEIHVSPHFRIFYDQRSTEDYARKIGTTLETARSRIEQLGYPLPEVMRRFKVDVTLRPIGNRDGVIVLGTAARIPTDDDKSFTVHMEINLESTFQSSARELGEDPGDLIRGNCAHEFFHLVQYQWARGHEAWLLEGTAVWAEAKTWPPRTAEQSGTFGFKLWLPHWYAVRRLSLWNEEEFVARYASSVFFQYLTEHHPQGDGVIRQAFSELASSEGDPSLALARAIGDETAWGPETMRYFEATNLATLIRRPERNEDFSFQEIKLNDELVGVDAFPFKGIVATNAPSQYPKYPSRGPLAPVSYDIIKLEVKEPVAGPSVDVIVVARGADSDDFRFAAVHRQRKDDKWVVSRFQARSEDTWGTTTLTDVDFASEDEVYLVTTRGPAQLSANYEFSSLLTRPLTAAGSNGVPKKPESSEIETKNSTGPPEIRFVRVSRRSGSKTLVHYESGKSQLWPVEPGRVNVTIQFDRDVKDVDVRFGPAAELPVVNVEKHERSWRGTLDVPSQDLFRSLRGAQSLKISATSLKGQTIDTDPTAPGNQRNTKHRIVVGSTPPFLETVTATGSAGTFFEATWKSSDEVSGLDNLHISKMPKEGRTLSKSKDFAVPKEGDLKFAFHFSKPLGGAPNVTVSGQELKPLTGRDGGREWIGAISADKLKGAITADRPIPIRVQGIDEFGNQLDANPGTVAALDPKFAGNCWVRFEESLSDSGLLPSSGGTDAIHVLNSKGRELIDFDLRRPGSLKDRNAP